MKETILSGKVGAVMSMPFPHQNVYTRLKPSPVHGVGVFAILPIPAGILLFEDDTEAIPVDVSLIKSLTAPIRKLYNDFCPIEEGRYWCPKNLNEVSVGWYINHGDNPNVRCEGWNFYALRDIDVGEELIVDYNTYSPMIDSEA